jgi:hypothetical protein
VRFMTLLSGETKTGSAVYVPDVPLFLNTPQRPPSGRHSRMSA